MWYKISDDNNNDNNDANDCSACRPGLGACGASLSLLCRLVLSDLIEAGNRQAVHVRQSYIVSSFPRLANMTWTVGCLNNMR